MTKIKVNDLGFHTNEIIDEQEYEFNGLVDMDFETFWNEFMPAFKKRIKREHKEVDLERIIFSCLIKKIKPNLQNNKYISYKIRTSTKYGRYISSVRKDMIKVYPMT